jgi:hypothetical protein
MTDCILACDGKIACELECKQRAVGCVEACSSDAGAAVAPRREMTVDAGVALVEAGDAARPDASRARPPLDAGPRVPGRAEAGAQ